MRKTTYLTAAVMILCATAATAAPLSNFYIIPSANHIPRADGVEKTDVAISNPQTRSITVSIVLISYGLRFTQGGIDPVTTVTVPAGGSALLVDVLKELPGDFATTFGASLGALIVASDDGSAFAVTSRSYIERSDGSTVGTTIPATANFLQNATTASGATKTAIIPGVRNNARYRTQVGFVVGNLEGLPAFIEFTLVDANGNAIGSPKGYFIDAGLFEQLEVPVTEIATQTFDIASIRVRVVGGGAVTAYAKVIDRVSGDMTFISADEPSSTLGTNVQNPFRSLMQRMGAIR